MVDGDRPWMRGEREFFDLRFEKCQVWRAVVSRVVRLAVPALRIEGLGESLRRTAVDAGFGLDCGGFDPGNQRGAARWLASDYLRLPARQFLNTAGTEVRLGSKRCRWCDSGTAEMRDSSSARPRPGRSSSPPVDSASSESRLARARRSVTMTIRGEPKNDAAPTADATSRK